MRDAVRAVRHLLADDGTVAAACPGGVRAYSLVSGQTFPAVRITRLGGPGRDEQHGARDIGSVRVECWGEHGGYGGLTDLVEACRDALEGATNKTTPYGGVRRVRELTGPTWAPDPTDDRPRFTWTVELTLTLTEE